MPAHTLVHARHAAALGLRVSKEGLMPAPRTNYLRAAAVAAARGAVHSHAMHTDRCVMRVDLRLCIDRVRSRKR